MSNLVDLSDKLWSGEHSTHQKEHHPFAILNVIEEVADGVGFYKGFSNLTAVRTGRRHCARGYRVVSSGGEQA